MHRIFTVIICTFFSLTVFAQEMGFDVFGTQTHPHKKPYAILTLDTLDGARTLDDIYARFPASWIAQYLSVEISSTCDGKTKKAQSKSDILTAEQITLLNQTETGCTIDVSVDYIPANNLSDNPAREFHFSLTPFRLVEAKYPGGSEARCAYLKEHIIEPIAKTQQEPLKFVAARFTISENAEITDIHLTTPSGDKQVDTRIVEALRSMPKWTPAFNAAGEAIAQEFEFTMGTDLMRCDFVY